MKIAIIQKCPNNTNYQNNYRLNIDNVYSLSSVKVARLLKRDTDLLVQDKKTYDNASSQGLEVGFCAENYDYVILIGSEALKHFTDKTSVTDYTGKQITGKCGYPNFIASINPGVLAFKPENRPVFDASVANIHKILEGEEERQNPKEYHFFRNTDEIREYLTYVLKNTKYNVIGLDSETSSLAVRRGHVLGVSLSHKPNQGVYMDGDYLDLELIDMIQKIINTREIVLHNAKFDLNFLGYHFGLEFHHRQGHVHDTMILHYLLDERQGTHGLKSLAMKYTDLGNYDEELDKFVKDYCKTQGLSSSEFSYEFIPWGVIKVYAAKDTDATIQLFNKFYPIVQNNPLLSKCYHEVMLPGLHLLTKIEDRGVPISKNRLLASRKILDNAVSKIEKDIWSYSEVLALEADQGKIFNPASTQQLRKLLFDYVGLEPTGKLTGTGAISTDEEVLTKLGEVHPLPQLVLEYRKSKKLVSTYIDKLLRFIDMDSKVRTGFNQCTTTSGRLSSSGNFNMQQLPRDNPLIKGCVVAPKGYKIVALDLRTAEIYFAAVLSGDEAMQQVFVNMQKDPIRYPDFHSSIAHMVFNLPCLPSEVKDLYPELRQAAKAISFGILYGSGPAKVAEEVNKSLIKSGQEPTCGVEDARDYIASYFSKFTTLKSWITRCHNEIKQNGFIYSFFGRKRRLLNINSSDKGIAASEVRSGANAIIQSISSDVLLVGVADADIEILEKGIDAEIFGLVHDSVVALVKEDQIDTYIEVVVRNIQKDRGCSIPDTPIGVSADTEEGGSENYSGGKLAEYYPELLKVA